MGRPNVLRVWLRGSRARARGVGRGGARGAGEILNDVGAGPVKSARPESFGERRAGQTPARSANRTAVRPDGLGWLPRPPCVPGDHAGRHGCGGRQSGGLARQPRVELRYPTCPLQLPSPPSSSSSFSCLLPPASCLLPPLSAAPRRFRSPSQTAARPPPLLPEFCSLLKVPVSCSAIPGSSQHIFQCLTRAGQTFQK